MLYNAVLVMKIGYYAEGLDGIIAWKKREDEERGRFFWGYNGTLCHPLKVVQPIASSQSIKVLMLQTSSQYSTEYWEAKEYSINGRDWLAMPEGLRETHCKFALVCSGLRQVDYDVDLSRYRLLHGPHAGVALSEYIKFHVDKGIGVLSEGSGFPCPKRVAFEANLVKPYAVLLR